MSEDTISNNFENKHGDYLDHIQNELKNNDLIRKLKRKYLKWKNCQNERDKLKLFLEYDDFLWENIPDLKKILRKKNRDQATVQKITGSNLEEYIFDLVRKLFKNSDDYQISSGKILNFIGFDTENDFELIDNYQNVDIAIGKIKNLTYNEKEIEIFIPKFIIECKRWIDKSQLRNLSSEASLFKRTYPYSGFFVVLIHKNFKDIDAKLMGRDIDEFFILDNGHKEITRLKKNIKSMV